MIAYGGMDNCIRICSNSPWFKFIINCYEYRVIVPRQQLRLIRDSLLEPFE